MSLTGRIKTLFSDSVKTEALFPRTKVKAVSDDNNVGLNVLLDNKQEKHKAVSVTLRAAGWVNQTQTVNVGVVSATNTVIVGSAPQNFNAYSEAGVFCSEQSTGQLTFACSAIPAVDLVANIFILN